MRIRAKTTTWDYARHIPDFGEERLYVEADNNKVTFSVTQKSHIPLLDNIIFSFQNII